MSIKKKAISGVLWNATGRFSSMGIEFVVGVILARLLSPHEFGLVGSVMIFFLLSEVFINSGFSQALVRKQNCTQKDFSTVFFFNLFVGLCFFLIIFAASAPISAFFDNPQLKAIVRVQSLGLLISAFSLVHRAQIVKQINFKLDTKISLIASTSGGITAIAMAINGFGVWSLVVKLLLTQGLQSIMLWVFNKWLPSMIFSKSSFKELFGFGSKLLLSGLIGTVMSNVYNVVIARYFSPTVLGYYNRADLFRRLASENVSSIVTAVGYPVLAEIQHDRVQMKAVFRKMLIGTFFIISVLMTGIIGSANNLILAILGDQWLPAVPMLQLLCVFGLLFPINTQNVNILNVVGRSDLYLKLQLILQLLVIPNAIAGVLWGVNGLILGQIFIAMLGAFLFTREATKFHDYTLKAQIADLLPSALFALLIGGVVFVVGLLTGGLNPLWGLVLQGISGGIVFLFMAEWLQLEGYVFLKTNILPKFTFINKLKTN